MSTKKRASKRILPALIAATLAVGAAPANAVTYSGVFVFGDSLSDAGYFRPFLTAIGVPATTVSTLGRFTTNPGPVWSEIIAQYYGGNPAPSNAGGGIFAQGGARVAVASTSTPPGFAQRPVSTQITEHLTANAGAASSTALYAIWAGGNDLLQAGAGGVASANDVAAQSARLRAAGARNIIIFGLPNLGLTPSAQAGGAAAVALQTQASAGFNITLWNAVAATGQRVIPVDVFTMLNEVAANASAFGFTNISGTACGAFPPFTTAATASSQFCTGSTLVAGATPSNYLFADGIHPTTAAHAITADFVKQMIDGPNAYSTMAEVPLGSRASHIRTVESGLQQGNAAAVGKANFFAAADGGRYDLSTTTLNPRTESKDRTVSVGATYRVNEDVTVGIAVGNSKADATMSGFGQYALKETTASIFASMRSGGLYGNFTLSTADLKFNDISRIVRLGQVTRVNRASTTGSNASGSFAFGYDFGLGPVSVGPFAQLTSQSISVGGFQENAGATTAASTDLKIAAQDRTSQVTSFGVRASANLGLITPFVRLSYDQEQKNDPRIVSASPVTVTQNIWYDVPGYRGDNRWSTATIGIRGNLGKQVGFGLSYTTVSGKDGIKQDGLTGSVNVSF